MQQKDQQSANLAGGGPESETPGGAAAPITGPPAALRRDGSLYAQRPFEAYGTLVSAGHGYPLVGLEVEAYFRESTTAGEKTQRGKAPTRRPEETLLGSGQSGPGGGFRINFLDTSEAQQRLCLLKQSSQAFLVLKVLPPAAKHAGRSRRTPYLVSSPLTGSTAFPITLAVPLPERRVPASLWKEFGARLKKAHVARLHEVARQLILAPPAHSLFGDWDLETRHNMLAALEQAFLDPEGKLQKAGVKATFQTLSLPGAPLSDAAKLRRRPNAARLLRAYDGAAGLVDAYGSIFAADRTLDVNELSAGNLGEAIHKISPEMGEAAKSVFEEKAPEELIPYRDYLLQIFTGSPTSDKYNDYRQEIETRFHQDFGTSDLTRGLVNRILIPIVRSILTSPRDDGYGFGLDPNTIQPQGEESDRDYLESLISLSGFASHELGLRYRLNLERPDSAHSSPVEENIAVLQGFYRDNFQDLQEGYQWPLIVPPHLRDRAPFFLEFEEWLRYTGPFYPENYYQARTPFLKNVTQGHVDFCKMRTADPSFKWNSLFNWFLQLTAVQDKLDEGHKAYDRGQYAMAWARYQEASVLGQKAIRVGIQFLSPPLPQEVEEALVKNHEALLKWVKSLPVTNMSELENLERACFCEPEPLFKPGWIEGLPFESWLLDPGTPDRLHFCLLRLSVYRIPLYLGDCALSMGDYEEAIRQYGNLIAFTVSRATIEKFMGYQLGVQEFPQQYYGVHDDPNARYLFTRGSLPYSISRDSEVRDAAGYAYMGDPYGLSWYRLAPILVPNYTNSVEVKVHDLRFAGALLEWADALYRTDDPSNIARARELYKGVFWVHGRTPPVFPAWPEVSAAGVVHMPAAIGNPAIRSQLARARRGLEQIEAGLNYYGCSEDIVPALRYRTLKEAADHFAAAAQSAQKDFLVYMGNIEKIIEQTLRDDLVNANMLKKAALQREIASEQAKIAEADVGKAQQQVAAVEAAIDAKQEEIVQDDTFWDQFTDFCSGFMGAMKGVPGEVTGAAGLAGAGPAVGFGLFVYGGYCAISSMCDEDNRLRSELRALEEQALPAARAQVVLKQRELHIANLQGAIAQADADLARSLSAAMREFQLERFLSAEFWAKLAALMRGVMRRYLELGARYAWLAERALAYEQDRPVHIIRFDYFPARLQGVSGADLLQMDLDELEASRLAGLKQTVPVKHTYSLALDFPLAFSQLKKTGRCTFRSEEKAHQLVYPGLYGYRIRAVSLEVQSATSMSRARGLLANDGVSWVSRSDGMSHVSVRYPEAAPLSEFRLKDDMAVYGLPDECLFNFEGSGINTYWTLEFPVGGLDSVADILITLDSRAYYSAELHKKHLDALPKEVRRMVLVSARKWQSEALEALHGSQSAVTLAFDLTAPGLPRRERDKKIANLATFLPGLETATINARLRWGPTPSEADFKFTQGMAFSKYTYNNKVHVQPTGPSALDKLLGREVEQTIELVIDPAANPGVDFRRLRDVVLGVEYTAHY